MPTTINPSGQTITQFNVQTGGTTNLLNNVPPSAASGVPLISQGAAAQPIFGTAAVAGGGTGATTITGVLIGNGTSAVTGNPVTQFDVLVGGASNAITSVGPGSAGQVLQSGGNAANPAYSTATYPSTTTSQQILYSTATNTVGELTTANSKFPATNAAGTLAMRAFTVNRQVFTSTGTYTPTTGMLWCDIEVLGGGGGGGGTAAGTLSTVAAAGGGGTGGGAKGVFSAATIGASKAVTIGAAGAAGAAGANTGGTGGTTSVGALISATGGLGGVGATNNAFQVTSGGATGTGTGGDFQFAGSCGGNGIAEISSGIEAISCSGFGGSTLYGPGGIAVFSSVGSAGQGFGSGGSGASLANDAAAARAGGAGAKGVVIITEYIIN